MRTHEELAEHTEKLEKVLDYIVENDLRVPLTVESGPDRGLTQKVPLKVVLQSLMNHLNIRPTFKSEINFVSNDETPASR
jgi:hypothetical protein